MKKFIINGTGTIHFNVEVEAENEVEAKKKVREMDDNELNIDGIFIGMENMGVE